MPIPIDLPPCDIPHRCEHVIGWETDRVAFTPDGGTEILLQHLVPCGDVREHILDPTCWCRPVEDTEVADYWVHNSADRREEFECDQRKPS